MKKKAQCFSFGINKMIQRICGNCDKAKNISMCFTQSYQSSRCERWWNNKLSNSIITECPNCKYKEYKQNEDELLDFNIKFEEAYIQFGINTILVNICPNCGILFKNMEDINVNK